MADRVGFVGVGRMGAPMARRLLAHGHELVLHDVRDDAVQPFRGQAGVTVAASPRAVATRAPVVLLSLPSPEALEAVALGPDGLAAAGPDRSVVDLSTSGVRATRAVAAALTARGVGFLDAPVSGGVPGAERGTLAVMAAGDAALFACVRPLLEVIGKNVFYVGAEPGQGQAMKLVNNMLSATAMAATAEAMVVATKAGISPTVALDILNVSSGRSSATQDKFPRDVVTGRFDYGFLTQLMLKDVRLFAELAEALSVPTLVSPAVVAVWRLAVAEGLGPRDFTTIAQLFERWAGVEVRARAAE
jgi:3-hydroxyisobutyrate dehydrogenase-like beta-hydroxyacid dehydrogenase